MKNIISIVVSILFLVSGFPQASSQQSDPKITPASPLPCEFCDDKNPCTKESCEKEVCVHTAIKDCKAPAKTPDVNLKKEEETKFVENSKTVLPKKEGPVLDTKKSERNTTQEQDKTRATQEKAMADYTTKIMIEAAKEAVAKNQEITKKEQKLKKEVSKESNRQTKVIEEKSVEEKKATPNYLTTEEKSIKTIQSSKDTTLVQQAQLPQPEPTAQSITPLLPSVPPTVQPVLNQTISQTFVQPFIPVPASKVESVAKTAPQAVKTEVIPTVTKQETVTQQEQEQKLTPVTSQPVETKTEVKTETSVKKDSEVQPAEKNRDAINYLCTSLTSEPCENSIKETQVEILMAKISSLLSPQSQVSMEIVSSSDNTKIISMKGLITEEECSSSSGQMTPAPEGNQVLCSWRKSILPSPSSSEKTSENLISVPSKQITPTDKDTNFTSSSKIAAEVTATPSSQPAEVAVAPNTIKTTDQKTEKQTTVSTEQPKPVESAVTTPASSGEKITSSAASSQPAEVAVAPNAIKTTDQKTEPANKPATNLGATQESNAHTVNVENPPIHPGQPQSNPSSIPNPSENRPMIVIHCEEGNDSGWYVDDNKEIHWIDLAKACPETSKTDIQGVVDQSEMIIKILENPKDHPQDVNLLKKKSAIKLSNILNGNSNEKVHLLRLPSLQTSNNTQSGLQVSGDTMSEMDAPTFRATYAQSLTISPEGNISQTVSSMTLSSFLRTAQAGLISSERNYDAVLEPHVLVSAVGGGCTLVK